MATITIPSPSVILSSPTLEPIPTPSRSSQLNPKPRSQGAKPVAKTPSQKQKQRQRQKANVAFKPKQSKSRNGCVTCKKKRLKCDETPKSCLQCKKRNVECGGYDKDFKWVYLKEPNLNNKINPPPRAPKNSTIASDAAEARRLAISPTTSNESLNSLDFENDAESVSSHETYPIIEGGQDYYDLVPDNLSSEPSFEQNFSSLDPNFFEIPFQTDESYGPRIFSEFCSTRTPSGMIEDASSDQFLAFQSSCSGLSPKLQCIHLSGSDLDTGPPDLDLLPDLLPDLTTSNEHCEDPESWKMEEDIQQLPQFPNEESWHTELSRRHVANAGSRDYRLAPFYLQPAVHAGSPENLMSRFNRDTCGILSIKDGPSENPWRTHVWPLAAEEPALFHAILAMTAFHSSKMEPKLRLKGVEHIEISAHLLRRNDISSMRPETALATTLALAFSESWDVHVSTGYQHLRGAKILVDRALAHHNRNPLGTRELACLKFLCNTFTYMDVIARLTAVNADDIDDFESFISPIPTPIGSIASTEIDPLMGCASTLFPLIGRAANICRRARLSSSNSVLLISQANELMEQLRQWDSGTSFENPEDPSSEVQHALQTAEAYRYATLLYLHQAVPENPSTMTSSQLSQKVLKYLATVPRRSGLVIVQIYPLLAAGCEVTDAETRQWVRERWQYMYDRMEIGPVARSYDVNLEVWRRRDSFVARREATRLGKQNQRGSIGMAHIDISKEMSEAFCFQDMLSGQPSLGGAMKRENYHGGTSGRNLRMNSESPMVGSSLQRRRNSDPITENMEFEYTVRGRLHWVGVMKEWRWEVLLG